MMASQRGPVYEFGGFYLDTAQRLLLTAEGQRVALTSRAFDTLLVLVEHPGELLETDRLMDAVWQTITVEENNLQQTVTMLRRALGEKPEDHRFIVTCRGRGYRFVAPVRAVSGPPAGRRSMWRRSALWAGGVMAVGLLAGLVAVWPHGADPKAPGEATSVSVTAVPSIAVLPFTDLSPDGDQAYLSHGIADELLSQLSRLNGLQVAGRASSFSVGNASMAPQAVGERLGVGNILQGSVRKDGDRLRISARLIDTASGYQLWAKTFERQSGDVFAIQDEIARAVAGALSIALDLDTRNRVQGTGTRDFEAYNDYLAGTDLLRSGTDLQQAVIYLQRAIGLDPDYAAAWAALALAYGQSAWRDVGEGMRANLQKLGEAAKRAVELDPGLADGYVMLGQYNLSQARWSLAEQTFETAISLADTAGAHAAYATHLARTGRLEAARAHISLALDRDPLHPLNLVWRAMIETAQGHIPAALADIERCAELGYPEENLAGNRLVILLNSGDADQVKQQLETVVGLRTFEAPLLRSLVRDFESPERARATLRQAYADHTLQGPGSRSYIGLLAAYFGDAPLALQVMSDEVRESSVRTAYLWFPVFAEMRRLPEFKTLVRDLKLVDYWTEHGWPDGCQPTGQDDFSCN